MKVLHLNAGNETGGGMHHLLMLLKELPSDEVVLGVFEEGELSRRATEIGIKTVVFKQESRKDFSVLKRIVKYLEKENIVNIHTHGARANLYGVFIARRSKCQWFLTVHSNPDDDFLGRGLTGKAFTVLNKWSIKKASHLFAISDRFSQMLYNYGIDKKKITTIYNGIDFEAKSSDKLDREDLKLTTKDFVLLMVARLEKVKNHELALQSIAKVVARKPNVKLLVVGEGSERKYIESLIQKLNLNDNVILLGQREHVIDIYPLADITLLTSKSESFPLVLLESARAQVPAITTDVGGVELMIPGVDYGWVIKDDHSDAISEAINKAIEYKKMGKLMRIGEDFNNHCKREYSIEQQANAIYKIYQRLAIK